MTGWPAACAASAFALMCSNCALRMGLFTPSLCLAVRLTREAELDLYQPCAGVVVRLTEWPGSARAPQGSRQLVDFRGGGRASSPVVAADGVAGESSSNVALVLTRVGWPRARRVRPSRSGAAWISRRPRRRCWCCAPGPWCSRKPPRGPPRVSARRRSLTGGRRSPPALVQAGPERAAHRARIATLSIMPGCYSRRGAGRNPPARVTPPQPPQATGFTYWSRRPRCARRAPSKGRTRQRMRIRVRPCSAITASTKSRSTPLDVRSRLVVYLIFNIRYRLCRDRRFRIEGEGRSAREEDT